MRGIGAKIKTLKEESREKGIDNADKIKSSEKTLANYGREIKKYLSLSIEDAIDHLAASIDKSRKQAIK